MSAAAPAAARRIERWVARVAPEAAVDLSRPPAARLPGVSWDGRRLRPTGLTLESQLHDVAHLLVCPPARRALQEFGLGPDPYRRSFTPRVVPEAEAEREELDTCTLQLALARLLGLDEAAVREEYGEPPLDRPRLLALRARRPGALPAEDWEALLARS